MTSYVDANLMKGEEVRHLAKLHWFMYVPHILLMFVLIGFFTILIPIIRQFTTEMAITNKRVIIKTGLISRTTLEMNLSKVETISVDQSIFGRIFGYGTLVIVGTGGTKEPFSQVASPMDFRKHFNEAVDSAI